MMIPNQFHFIFGLQRQTEPFHLVHYLCLESCFQVNQPERVYFYYHYQPYGYYWDLIKDKLDLVQVPLVPRVAQFKYQDRSISQFRYAHHSDFIRLEQLILQGGIYADMDTLFVHKIPDQLFRESFVVGREPDIYDPNTNRSVPSICNALIMSQPGADFGIHWLEQMGEAFDGTWSNHSTLLPQRISEEFPNLVHIEPIESFYKYPGSREGLRDLFEKLDTSNDDVLSIHLWAHLWWSRLRMDFSFFHAGLITEDYLQRADTTYALLARDYLPGPKPAAIHRLERRSAGNMTSRILEILKSAKLVLLLLAKISVLSLLGEQMRSDAEEVLESSKQQLKFLLAAK